MKYTPRRIWNRIRYSPLAWDTVTTTGWNVLGRGVGFLVPFFLAAWFGVDEATDALFFAYGLIVFAAGIFAPAVESMTVPFIAEIRSRAGDPGRFVGRMLCLSGAGMAVLALLLITGARPLLGLVTRFDAEAVRMINRLLLLTAPLLVMLVWTSVLTGYLNAYKKFAFPAVAPAFRALVNLAVIYTLKDTIGVYAVALGYLAGEIARLLLLLTAIFRTEIPPPRFSFGLSPEMRNFLSVSFYQTVALAAVHFKSVVDKAMASWLEPGSVSVLEYSYRLYLIPLTFMSAGLFVAILSHWSDRYYDRGERRLARDAIKAVKLVSAISLLVVAFFIVLARPLVNLAYNRGEFDAAQVPLVSLVWIFYLLGFLPKMISAVLTRGHLTLKNTKILMKNAFIINIVNLIMNYLLMWRLQAPGIALSTSIASLFSLAYLTYHFNRDRRIVAEKTGR